SRLLVRLDQLYAVARRVVDQHLLSANAGHDIVPKMDSLLAQRLSDPFQIRYLQRYPIPATRLWLRSIRHRLATTALTTRRTQQQTQIAPVEHRECRRRVHRQAEPQIICVELDRRIDVVHDVAHTDCCHECISPQHDAVRCLNRAPWRYPRPRPQPEAARCLSKDQSTVGRGPARLSPCSGRPWRLPVRPPQRALGSVTSCRFPRSGISRSAAGCRRPTRSTTPSRGSSPCIAFTAMRWPLPRSRSHP